MEVQTLLLNFSFLVVIIRIEVLLVLMNEMTLGRILLFNAMVERANHDDKTTHNALSRGSGYSDANCHRFGFLSLFFSRQPFINTFCHPIDLGEYRVYQETPHKGRHTQNLNVPESVPVRGWFYTSVSTVITKQPTFKDPSKYQTLGCQRRRQLRIQWRLWTALVLTTASS